VEVEVEHEFYAPRNELLRAGGEVVEILRILTLPGLLLDFLFI
jgi:hypothetical protein